MIDSEHGYLKGFVNLQRELVDVPDECLYDFLDRKEAPFAYRFFNEFGGRELIAHSVGSLLIQDETQTQIVFGELHHIGEVQSLIIQADFATRTKQLCLVFDATAIALPPGIDFDPLYQSVHIPVAGLESIKVA